MRVLISGLCLFISFSLSATDYRPWTFERDLDLYPRLDYAYEHFSSVSSGSASKHLSSHAHFIMPAVAVSYAEYSGEVELVCAETSFRSSFGFDHFKITGRYQLWNDINGESPISLTLGATVGAVSFAGLHDLSSFHLGRWEGKLFLSLGKECTVGDNWSSRWWGVTAFCLGDRGSPGLLSRWMWEKRSFSYEWGTFANLLVGFGNRSLHPHNFSGYGSVRYRAVDLGFLVRKSTDCGAVVEGEIKQRVWACQFPKAAFAVQISYTYPLGGNWVSYFKCRGSLLE